MTRARAFALFAILLFPACSLSDPKSQTGLYEAGTLSKVTAESAYKTIYAASLRGQVSTEVAVQAREAYQAWAAAQAAFVVAASGAGGDVETAKAAATQALGQLMAIAIQHGLLTDIEKTKVNP